MSTQRMLQRLRSLGSHYTGATSDNKYYNKTRDMSIKPRCDFIQLAILRTRLLLLICRSPKWHITQHHLNFRHVKNFIFFYKNSGLSLQNTPSHFGLLVKYCAAQCITALQSYQYSNRCIYYCLPTT